MSTLTDKCPHYYSSVRTDMLQFIDITPSKILDIGCGTGNFSSNFPDCEYLGIEPDINAVKQAHSCGRRVIQGLYDNVADEIPNGHYDLIVCNDVIEHMIDPAAFLRDIKCKLSKGGKLIASLPNIRNIIPLYDLLVHSRFTYTNAGILDYTHLHLFTMKSFMEMAENCGWNIELCETTTKTTDLTPIKMGLVKLMEIFLGDLLTYQFAVRATIAYQ